MMIDKFSFMAGENPSIKSGYTESVRRRAKEEGTVLLTIDDLFF